MDDLPQASDRTIQTPKVFAEVSFAEVSFARKVTSCAKVVIA